MTTRQTAAQEQVQATPGAANLPTGYENEPSETFHIPSCGIDDVDRAMVRLFDQEIGFVTRQVRTNSTVSGLADVNKPPVVFATGERFALAKKLKPIRDQNKVLILPLISVRRSALEMSQEDISGRGMNQSTGAIVLKRRLDRSEDRSFQAILNRFGLTNLPPFQPSTRRDAPSGDLRRAPPGVEGALLDGGWTSPETNVFEILVVPQPKFFTAVYEVIYWTNYQQHMNYLIDTTLASFLPQGRDWKLTTPKGYWFLASVEEGLNSGDNFDNWKDDERIVKFTFQVRVKGYVFAPSGPGHEVPVRRYLSSPQVVFEVQSPGTADLIDQTTLERPPFTKEDQESMFVLSDPEEATVAPEAVKRASNQSRTLVRKTFVDPRTGKVRNRYVSVDNTGKRSPSGETTYSSATLEALEDILIPS